MRIVLSGASGGGKSTLLAALAARGFAVVAEPGRRLVKAELAVRGTALPWVDGLAFVRRLVALAEADLDAAPAGVVFFDRGLVDAAMHLHHVAGVPIPEAARRAYRSPVFLVPPWREIYVADAARRHGFADGVAEYERLAAAYPALGYDVAILPKASVAARVDLILTTLRL
ncbi:AAA family ATPase [Acuticoccus mangrovi]|uniref:AAA family ATPase n=1 Tax=Acuticoccus mangrovi TaxID=2796142 RepID=A0A934MGG5_9HYPH|nr:AAA family ATPase [Acuticoccus mangrovi]